MHTTDGCCTGECRLAVHHAVHHAAVVVLACNPAGTPSKCCCCQRTVNWCVVVSTAVSPAHIFETECLPQLLHLLLLALCCGMRLIAQPVTAMYTDQTWLHHQDQTWWHHQDVRLCNELLLSADLCATNCCKRSYGYEDIVSSPARGRTGVSKASTCTLTFHCLPAFQHPRLP